MSKLSVIIPVRNKEIWRLKEVIKRLKSDLIKEIIVVDYFSDEPIKLSGKKVKVIRYNKKGCWNKAHAINIGFKKSSGDFIMTVDADIIIDNTSFDNICLDNNSYCYSGNVRRINRKDLSSDFNKMWEKSANWVDETSYAQEMYGLANGGLQIYPTRLLSEFNGIDENLVYSGGMDNITNLMAKKLKMNIVQLPVRLLHIEHLNTKEKNFPKEEQVLAFYLKTKRGDYLNQWIKNPVINKFYGRLSGPCYSTYLDSLKEFQENIDEIKTKITMRDKSQSKIMIAIINNTGLLPDRFVRSLLGLYNTTIDYFPNTTLKFIKACQVNHMRNIAVKTAIEEEFDYLIQLDVDHIYDPYTIINLIRHDKDFVTVPTKQRVSPFLPTQYKEILNPIKQPGNAVYVKKKEGLIEIGCSGPVAMLMKVSALRKFEFPYYYMDYSFGFDNTMGGDFVFSRQIEKRGFKLFLDPTIDCPHFVKAQVSSFNSDAEISLDDGSF